MNSTANPAAAETPFTWTDKFLLGFGPMDATHREFVEAVNAILAADDTQMLERFDAFIDHATRHFEEERKWMEETEFPPRQCHMDEHAAVMKSVEQVREVVAGGDVSEGRRLAQALVDWFPGHADYMDASLSQWMCKKRLGGTPVVLRRNILEKDQA